jgi:hypothetical protein
MMQKRYDRGNLIVFHRREAGHAFVGSSIADGRPQQISAIIMAYDG